MAKPVKRIWCPKCFKRHRLPDQADGLTLRCLGCRYAFRVQDGLLQDPKLFDDIVQQEVESSNQQQAPSVVSKPERTVRKSRGSESVQQSGGKSSGTAILENDYDDILSVLESPVSSDAPPPRAHAKPKKQASATSEPTELASGSSESNEEPVVRQPVTREQLRTHRNRRQLAMLISLIFAIALGAVSWICVNVVMKPTIGDFEREILYSFGVPARWLPPGDRDDGPMPSNLVKLRGNHADLADRSDLFRDEFPEDIKQPVGEDDEELANEPAPNRRNIDRLPPDRNRLANRLRDKAIERDLRPAQPNNARPLRNGRRNRVGARGFGPAPNAWQPPELSQIDRSRILGRGIDPKNSGSFTIDDAGGSEFALTEEVLFFVNRNKELVAVSQNSGKAIASRRIDGDVSALAATPADEISKRPAAWVHLGNGKIEKWEVVGETLNRVVRLQARPVFEEGNALLTVSNQRLAYVRDQQIHISSFLPAAQQITETVEVPLDEQVVALKFSQDGSKLAAVVGLKFIVVNAADGNIESETSLSPNYRNAVSARKHSVSIADDLQTVFVANQGSIDAIAIKDQNSSVTGQYWSSLPDPMEIVISDSKLVFGFSAAGQFRVSKFNLTTMLPEQFVSTDRAAKSRSGDSEKPNGELVSGAAADMPQVPWIKSLSPKLTAGVESMRMLDNRIVFLTDERIDNRLAIADADDNWNVVPLKINIDGRINHFSLSADLRNLVVAAGDIVQAWTIDDVATGTCTLVSEYAGHLDRVTSVIIMPDQQHVVSGDLKGNIHSWTFEDGNQVAKIEGLRSEVIDIAAKSDRAFVAMSRIAFVSAAVSSKKGRSQSFDRPIVGAAGLSVGGTSVASQLRNRVRIANLKRGKWEDVGFDGGAQSIVFTNDPNLIIIQNRNQAVLWNWRKEQQIRRFRVSADQTIGATCVSSDNQQIAVAVGRDADQIAIFELPTQE